MGYWPVVFDLIRNVDIVVVVGDARMPDVSVNQEVVKHARKYGKEVLIVFTKRDLIGKARLVSLQGHYPEALFVAGVKNEGVSALRRKLQILGKRLKLYEPKIGVVGYPNIGKSALINALARRNRAPVANQPGTTKGVQWIKAGGLRILDSPGVIPAEDKNRKLALLGSKTPDMLPVPEKNAFDILTMFLVKCPETLKEHYSITEDLQHEPYDLLLQIGKARRFLKKGGAIDEDRTARTIIREWQTGKLRLD
jgi:ribosome biogenesis GTPase A